MSDRGCGDGEGRPASLLVMPAPEDQREGAGLLLYLRWGEGEWDELRRRGPGERDCQGRRGCVERCRPSDELLSSETSRLSHRERLAGGDIRRVGEEESGDVGGCLTLARVWSEEDFSRDPLWRRVLLPARFEPVLCWARDASRSSCVGAHVLVRNRGNHCWLRWSVTYKLFPTVSHVLHKLLLPA